MMVTETAYGPALNRYAANPHSTMAEAQPPKGVDGLVGHQQNEAGIAKRSTNRP